MGRLEDLAYEKFLLAKRILHLVSSEKFGSIVDSDQEYLESLIRDQNIEDLKTWLSENYILNMHDKSVHNLRQLASKLRIKNYSRKGKERLVKQINKTLDEMIEEISPFVGKRSQAKLRKLKESHPEKIAEFYDHYLPVKDIIHRMSEINMTPELYETKDCTDYHEYQTYYRLLMILRKEVNNA